MRIILVVLCFYITNACAAQDPNFPDYRSKKDIFTRIVEKDIRSDIASFSMGGLDESLGKLPLKTLPATAVGSNFITFETDNLQVKIVGGTFDPKQHKLGYYEEKYLVKIDNKPYFGDYGKVPKTTIQSVTVIAGRDTIVVPPAAYVDLYNPIFSVMDRGVQKSQNKVFLSADGRKIYIYMLKTEAGGSYEVTWVIQDRKYLRRVVDFGFLK
ncbi:MAG: hypothetical protein JWQ40_1770 [Segetibacter sp.]|nr:hypothetical protein [Segetibacter sp.]